MAQLSSSILGLLNDQFAHEKQNQLRYAALATSADFFGLNGTAAFFRKESEGEAAHAQAVYDFINLRNEHVNCQIDQIESMPDDFYSYFDVAMAIELDTTERLKYLATAASQEGDLQTFFWASDLIQEQSAEENEYRTILDRMTLCGKTPDLIHHYDQWIGKLNG